MAEVVEFKSKAQIEEDNIPHLSGTAVCMQCKEEWVAVVPAGTVWLECPKCGSMKGLMKYSCERKDTMHWTCQCGSQLFHITQEGTYCPNCGTWQCGY